jgi:hypothetical protein
MSRRTFPRIAAAGILAVAGLITFPLPLQAQRLNPWRGGEVAIAPAPRPARCTSSAVECCSGDQRAAQTVVLHMESFATAPATMPTARPTGNWYRELPGMVVGLSFRDKEIRITLDHNIDGASACITLVGDYAVTRDGTIHGVITGTDVSFDGKSNRAQFETIDVSRDMQTFVDQPFAFRCRVSDGKLMVSNWRIACPKGPCEDVCKQLLAGIFQPVTGTMPEPKPVNDEAMTEHVPASGRYLEHNPEYFPPEPILSREIAPQPWPVLPPPPLRTALPPLPPPPEVRGIRLDAFNQMMSQMQPPSLCAQAPYLPPQPAISIQVPPLCAVPAPPIVGLPVPTLQSMPAVAPNKMPVGTWTREMGPIKHTIDIKDGHLSITITLNDGKNGTIHHILTADCYPTRSGGELVGLLTSFDIAIEGRDAASDVGETAAHVAKLQKEIAEQPFAVTFRIYEGTLVIGNVRLSAVGEAKEVGEILSMIAGRYKRSNDSAPRPMPTRVTKACDGPQCVPVSACTPPAVTIQPVEYQPVYGGPPSYQPPVPPMPAPTALPTEIRMKELLEKSEDLRQIDKEWRRFWYSDPKSWPPERIHGGILLNDLPAIPTAQE